MKKIISFVLANLIFASLSAQTLAQFDELVRVRTNNGASKELNILLSTDVPVQYVLPDEYKDKPIVEKEVDTYYSGKKTLRMQQAEDGTYILVDPERSTYTLEGLAKSDLTVRDITSNAKLAEHTASFIKNAKPKMDADGASYEEVLKRNPDIIIIHDYDSPSVEEKIAEIKGITTEEVLNASLENIKTLYNII